jgi:hypothetical protein
MSPKSLKVTFPIYAETAAAAIATLSGQFLRLNQRGSAKVVSEATDFSLVKLCHPLINDWHSGKVPFAPGEITLTFTSGTLSQDADLLIYKPVTGDRLLYTARSSIESTSEAPASVSEDSSNVSPLLHLLQTVMEALNEMVAHQRAVETRLQAILTQTPSPISPTGTAAVDRAELQALIRQALDAQTAEYLRHLQTALNAQATGVTQLVAHQVAAQIATAIQQFNERFEGLQAQLGQLATQIRGLAEAIGPVVPAIPQDEAEWLQRITTCWGTVGDYEQYSLSHRLANVETPLFFIPDWVALCELDWARKLHPTLALLYDFLHGDNGVGYGGADILQQFGCHVDPQTGDRYYIYHQGGFTAYEALWQTVYNPQDSWLPELQRLNARATSRYLTIFELFGWEADAIASLDSVVKQATYERQSERHHSSQQRPPRTTGNPLSDYLALLNIGPFTPITLETIKRAYRQAMKTAHPDTGGSKELAQKINEAYEAILNHYFPEAN